MEDIARGGVPLTRFATVTVVDLDADGRYEAGNGDGVVDVLDPGAVRPGCPPTRRFSVD